MTDPVKEIGRVRGADNKSTRGGIFKREKGALHPHEAEDDSVDISEEARDRSTGKKCRNILEYIENEEG